MINKVLVTGAGGYIGTVLVAKLLSQDYHVVALDRFFFGKDKLQIHPNLQIVQEDTRRMHDTLLKGIDAVIDLAALSNDPSGEAFPDATWEINCSSRIGMAKMAQRMGVKRYILSSSCSVYGFHPPDQIVDEQSTINPLTVYAQANAEAEKGVLAIAEEQFAVTVVRLATVYGCSPRMRFDLAVNAMALGAWSKRVIPLMRGGEQWRPMLHVEDAAEAMCAVLKAEPDRVNRQIMNVGANEANYQMRALAEDIASHLPKKTVIEWYGDEDHRSYRVDFSKIGRIVDWKAKRTALEGALQVYSALEQGRVAETPDTYTIHWYRELQRWHAVLNEVCMYGGALDLNLLAKESMQHDISI